MCCWRRGSESDRRLEVWRPFDYRRKFRIFNFVTIALPILSDPHPVAIMPHSVTVSAVRKLSRAIQGRWRDCFVASVCSHLPHQLPSRSAKLGHPQQAALLSTSTMKIATSEIHFLRNTRAQWRKKCRPGEALAGPTWCLSAINPTQFDWEWPCDSGRERIL